MPNASTPSSDTDIRGAATASYRSGLKVDGRWYPYAEACSRSDVRPGDQVQLHLDEAGEVTTIEITERGAGVLPASTISEPQQALVGRILDDKELTVGDLEEDFLRKYLGKSLEQLSKDEAGSLIDLFFGRRSKPGGSQGRGQRRR